MRLFFEQNKKQAEQYDKKLLDIDNRIKGYNYVIQDGVYLEEISNNLKNLQSHKAYILSKISSKIPDMDSEELIKEELTQGLFILSDQVKVMGFAPSWRAAMSLIVDKVITTPIPNKRRGMTIEVKIAGMEGWAEFYRRITAKRASG